MAGWCRYGLTLMGVWLALCANVWAGAAAVNLQTVLQHASAPFSLTPQVAVLEDPAGTLTVEQVAQGPAAAWAPAQVPEGRELNYSYTRSAYWLRFSLHNPGGAPAPVYVALQNSSLLQVTLFHALDSGGFHAQATGQAQTFAERPYPHRFFVFPLQVAGGDTVTYYLRVASVAPMQLPLMLWSPEAFHAFERSDDLAQFMFLGMALAMGLFNLLLYWALKDATYLRYVVFVAASTFALAAYNGLLAQWWPASASWLLTIAPNVGFCWALAALLWFMRRMLDLGHNAPALNRVARKVSVVLLLLPIGVVFSLRDFIRPTVAAYVFTALFVLGVALHSAWRGHRAGRMFLLAFALLCLSGVVTVLRSLGVLPGNALTTHAIQYASALQMLLFAFALGDRYKLMLQERAQLEREAQRAHDLSQSNAALSALNADLTQAYTSAEQARQAATEALKQLSDTQAQLVQADKMATLGQLVAGVAHEINTPIAAIKTSSHNMSDALKSALSALPPVYQQLDLSAQLLVNRLIEHAMAPSVVLSSREERAHVRTLAQQLEVLGVDDARYKASLLVPVHARPTREGPPDDGTFYIEPYLPLLNHPACVQLLTTAANLAVVAQGADQIQVAVEAVSKIVFALKSFSRVDHSGELRPAVLQDGLETVLTMYRSAMKQGVELVCQFEPIEPLWCLPDQLNQVWTNLIHNALQAMQYRGILTVVVRAEGSSAVVQVTDTGCGIAPEHLPRIFDVFFTTKPAGEGSGLGLDIVKKIVTRHHGQVEVHSTVGVGTTFTVRLPYREPAEAALPSTARPEGAGA